MRMYPAMMRTPDEVASATGNVVSTPNSKLIGKTGIAKKPRTTRRMTRMAVSTPFVFW